MLAWKHSESDSPRERRALRFVLQASIFNGMMNAVFTILPEMARQALGAGKTEITLLTLLWSAGYLFAIYWTRLLHELDNKSKLLWHIALFGRLPLMLCALFDNTWPMLGVLLVTVVSQPAVVICQHGILQKFFKNSERSRIVGWSLSAGTLSNLLSVLIFGILLDIDEQFYKLVLVVAGLAGMLEAWSLSRIQAHDPPTPLPVPNELKQGFRAFVVKPMAEFAQHMRRYPSFFRYERNFFLYGMGFMLLQPFVPIFLVNELNLSYTEISLAKGTILQTVMILIYPFSGRLLERKHPIGFSALAFLGIAVFPAALILISSLRPEPVSFSVYGAYMLFALPWTGVILMWHLSSLYFAKNEDVSPFSSAHMVMVGFRGLFALILSLFLSRILEPVHAFSLVLVLWLSASLGMFRQYREAKGDWTTAIEDDPDIPPMDASKVPVLPAQRGGRIG